MHAVIYDYPKSPTLFSYQLILFSTLLGAVSGVTLSPLAAIISGTGVLALLFGPVLGGIVLGGGAVSFVGTVKLVELCGGEGDYPLAVRNCMRKLDEIPLGPKVTANEAGQ